MIWLVGCRGMLGSELGATLTSKGVSWVGSDRDVDITDSRSVAAFACGKSFEWIVNCAAYTKVDGAESEERLATLINVEGPRNLAAVSKQIGARMLHISTDYVFSGGATRPYREDDPVDPLGVYGRTKAEGETAVRETCEHSLILRSAWLYGKYGSNFVYTMLKVMAQKDELGVVDDQFGSPTWTVDLAAAIVKILETPDHRYGIYHFTDGGETTWFEFAENIYRLGRTLGLLEKECAVRALATAQYPTPAKRPRYSVLAKDKILRDFGVTVPPWQESLEAFLQTLSADLRKERNLNPKADCETVMLSARALACRDAAS